jgi:acetoin utilization protein AcuB
MLIKNWMSKNVISVDVDDSMHDAVKRMKRNDIRMLPVLKKGKLVGKENSSRKEEAYETQWHF